MSNTGGGLDLPGRQAPVGHRFSACAEQNHHPFFGRRAGGRRAATPARASVSDRNARPAIFGWRPFITIVNPPRLSDLLGIPSSVSACRSVSGWRCRAKTGKVRRRQCRGAGAALYAISVESQLARRIVRDVTEIVEPRQDPLQLVATILRRRRPMPLAPVSNELRTFTH